MDLPAPSPENPALFLPAFALFWCGICMLISRVGGWRALGRFYRLQGRFDGERWYLRSGSMGLANYNGCLTLGADAGGLCLAVLFLFRPGHPPLLIPWRDVTVEPYRMVFLFHRVKLGFRETPSVSLRISRGLADKLAGASGGRFRVPGP
ncbi:hypothetical protein D0B54_18120 [Solimonas sp. K1W22B-7]|uniref:hypothetical protein n=1 Tax=Solimonas sp. K1W22B-7 TaxID=2303331 RepID=UPI000E3365D6|nr:hypothetical protein [Solimonas sp. K1W22B-7]AXQ30476.1 hypothetical protein D0B54_18120 [Solimonas sp. K1W22B-7]